MEEQEKKYEEQMAKLKKDYAVKDVIGYFVAMEDEIERLKREIESYKERFRQARDEADYRTALNAIEWAVHRMKQVDFHPDLAARASAKFAVAFDVDTW